MTDVTDVERRAPVGNAAGLGSAVEQIEAGALTRDAWMVAYDSEADIVRLRRPDAGPAITYESPAHPDFLVRLDVKSGILTGIDLMGAKSHLDEHSQRLRQLSGALTQLGGRKREQVGIDPSELVSNFVALSPVRLAANQNGSKQPAS
ncbi:MAG: hypothetical protein ABR498_07465 [Candidatus Dormibacteria bacterium]